MLRIQVGGVTILGRPEDTSSRVAGLFVGRDGFEGWDDGPDVRREGVALLSEHGEYDSPVFNGSRVISVDGHAIAWSEEELGKLRNLVMGIGADGKRTRLTVTHQGMTLAATVRRGARPTFRDTGIRYGRLRARFAIFLVAADPRKYGVPHEFAAGDPVTHDGNFPASPVLVVAGPQPAGYTVAAGTNQYTVTTPLPSGSTDEIDMSTGWVRRNGVLLVGGITRADTWRIPVGAPGLVHTITGGPGALTVRVTDTFM